MTPLLKAAFGVERSFAGRRWLLPEIDSSAVERFATSASVSQGLARLLLSRGVLPDGVHDYLNPTLNRLLPEPFLLTDMKKAAERVQRAIETCELIAVFGDYDVDGSCSAALLAGFLTLIGRTPTIYIPDRATEGYGPSTAAFGRLKQGGAALVITVDCGAGAEAALLEATRIGLDVVVLDHHATEKSGGHAYAHVNPNQAGDTSGLGHLCAAGITFLFLVALNRSLREAGWYKSENVVPPDLRTGLDLVGLATVCDVVPLTGVNRAFVRASLARNATAPRPAIKALAAAAALDKTISLYDYGFVLGPRINAGGRVGRCDLGVSLLLTESEGEATPLALQLERHNRERQAIENSFLQEAVAQAETQANAPFLLVAAEGWHSGVAGIIAGRLKDRFEKPAFVVAFHEGAGRGSARSIAGFDVGAAVRCARERGLLEAGGGHAMAAGFAIKASSLDAFRSFLFSACAGASFEALDTLELHAAVSASAVAPGLVAEVTRAGPFGPGNPEPVFVLPEVRVAFADPVGRGHVRVRLQGAEGRSLSAIAFRAAGTPLGEALLRHRGRVIHAAGLLKADHWNGQDRAQLQILDGAAASA